MNTAPAPIIEQLATPGETVVVAMSGGVDSSVAAAVLKEQGVNVIGITLQIWQESAHDTKGAGCCSLGAVEDARRVAARIGIPHYVLNYREPFVEKVIKPFVESYKMGWTPNPCINCNRYIKFNALMKRARQLGATKLATGHYARVFRDPATDRYGLLTAGSVAKDQSYALYASAQDELAHMTMPLGGVATKDETRELARRHNLAVAEKPDSQEICFVQNGDYRDFLAASAPETLAPGSFVDSSGKWRGSHHGAAHFTVGQRKKINVGSLTPLYVLSVNAQTGEVTIGTDDELYAAGCRVEDLNWVALSPLQIGGEPFPCAVKIRYNMPPAPAHLVRTGDDSLHVAFDEPLRAVAPGQAAVFYGTGATDGWVLGGGTITGKLSASSA